MDKPSKGAIDGDLIAYKAAACAQTDFIIVTHKPSGTERRFETRTDFYGHHAKKSGGWLGKVNKEREEEGKPPFPLEDFEVKDDREVEPTSHACQIAKQMIVGVCKGAGIDEFEIYLTGKENFRDHLATIYEYKGDRKDNDKPVHLQAVRDYLVNQYGAEIIEGMEADDKLAMLAASGEAIQCSIDKDQLQVAGWAYDWDKAEEPFEVKDGVGRLWLGKTESGKEKVRGVGFKNLCFQMLIGDDVDCIKPKYLTNVRYGEKTAFKDLQSIRSKMLCLQTVLDIYKKWYPEPVVHKHWRTGEEMTKTYFDIASEMFSLLYMLRSYGDNTTLKSLCDELGVEYGVL